MRKTPIASVNKSIIIFPPLICKLLHVAALIHLEKIFLFSASFNFSPFLNRKSLRNHVFRLISVPRASSTFLARNHVEINFDQLQAAYGFSSYSLFSLMFDILTKICLIDWCQCCWCQIFVKNRSLLRKWEIFFRIKNS